MNQTVTCAEMKEIERKANESGLSYYRMMENAGKSAVKVIIDKLQEIRNKQNFLSDEINVVIFCGKGNNGGDGYVVAKELALKGMDVTVIMADGNPKTEDAIKNANIVLRRGIPVIDSKAYFDVIPEIVQASNIVVDAIYGSGFHGILPENVRSCTKLINSKNNQYDSSIKKMVFALDIPTGLNGDAGEPDTDTVVADYTIAFHRAKPVHNMEEAKQHCGKIVVVEIGID